MAVKARLLENKKKDIEEILKIHKEIAQWLKDVFRKIENPPFK